MTVFCGWVECYSDGSTDLADERLLEHVLALNALHLIRCFMFGHIINAETVLFLDKTEKRVILQYLNQLMVSYADSSARAAMAMRPGDIMDEDKWKSPPHKGMKISLLQFINRSPEDDLIFWGNIVIVFELEGIIRRDLL